MEFVDFEKSVEAGHKRSVELLHHKAGEYTLTSPGDRLVQFKRISQVANISPAHVCMILAAKHFSSVCDMAWYPGEHNIRQWREKITDLRNYTHLLEALIEEELNA